MIKRSLNSYMNAWTGSDFTMYPFATTNQQDFKNLLSVYLDACFYPLLRKHDFMQEGHHLEFKDKASTNSELIFKGVVYNEMKGAMSNQDENYIHRIHGNLFEHSNYKYNSGGEPVDIPNLSYEELKEFHRKYYHPSNCTFLSYGDLDFTQHLAYIEQNALDTFKYNDSIGSELPLEPRWKDTKLVEEQFMPELISDP